MDDTAWSIGAVYQPRSAKQKHLWRSCLSPAHSFNRDQGEIMSGAAISAATKLKHVWRNGVDQGDVLTAISKAKYLWRSSISRARSINCDQRKESLSGAAVYHQRGVAVYQQITKSKAKAFLDDTAMSTWVVTNTISEAKTCAAQVCITSTEYQPPSVKRKDI